MVANWWQKVRIYLRNQSTARSFIWKQATLEDLKELERLIDERKKVYLFRYAKISQDIYESQI